MRAALLALLLLALPSFAQDRVMIKRVKSIYDGDSFRADITKCPPIVGERMPVRIEGIDTP